MTVPPPPQGQNPYAQTPPPPAGQQPGQPYPPQQPYAPFPQQQGAPLPPAPVPPRKGGKKALRVIGSIAVVLVVALLKFGAFFGISWFFDRDDAEKTSVGSCMHNDGTYSSPDLNEVDCSSSDAQYKVLQKFDDSSDEDKCKAVTDSTIYYVQSGNGHDVVLCLKETK
ncbi:LppU/SCO3897 family protein [Streptomyces mangrovisoli]|uniref:Uncharacterized protein n=1 Tax=Streptomyces mangrovisoli TaxID=1428628 RepID=A0A1J4P571_9ACTN|nr:hypothetical protein [Streptomyces mangrovisoli]OIJ69330.1 hypothetical protein WN71_003565 [Streptomyces mangrovisoli]